MKDKHQYRSYRQLFKEDVVALVVDQGYSS